MTCTIASRRSAEGVADSGDETTDMNQHEVSRTLVKSQPELWAELSDPSSLARHLDQFGEIRITRLEPETTVAWEGQRVSGTVRLEPSGWGTRVTLRAGAPEGSGTAGALLAEPPASSETPPPPPEPRPDPDPDPDPPEPDPDPPEPEPDPLPPAATGPRRGWWGRVARFFQPVPAPTVVLGPAAPRAEGPVPDEPRAADQAPAPEVPPEQVASPPAPAEPASPPAPPERAERDPLAEILTAALDSLGQAHHRPFSRA